MLLGAGDEYLKIVAPSEHQLMRVHEIEDQPGEFGAVIGNLRQGESTPPVAMASIARIVPARQDSTGNALTRPARKLIPVEKPRHETVNEGVVVGLRRQAGKPVINESGHLVF